MRAHKLGFALEESCGYLQPVTIACLMQVRKGSSNSNMSTPVCSGSAGRQLAAKPRLCQELLRIRFLRVKSLVGMINVLVPG